MRSVLACLLVSVVAVAQAGALSDPTQPMGLAPRSSAAPRASTGPALQSTMVSRDRKVAVISGKTVKIGDTFDGAVITDITPYEVRMTRGGRETTLRMLPKLVKDKGAVE